MRHLPLFWLGTHMPGWLWLEAFRGVPLFVSRRTLARRKRLGPALTDWALDSGGFTELQQHGRWTVSPQQYAEEVERLMVETGTMAWAAIQDWMCEPAVIAGGTWKGVRFAGTGLSVREHQARTVQSLLDLRALAPSVPWAPVLQGWHTDDYLRHIEDYASAGVDLTAESIVGVGSVCRRENTDEAEQLVREIRQAGIRPHGFGFKKGGVLRCIETLESADSLAWSYDARYSDPLPGCEHANCANCARYALRWRADLLARMERRACQPLQRRLF